MAERHTYGYTEVQRYLQRKMTPKEMHAFERALMDDPFLADALEGFGSSASDLAVQHLSQIEKELKGDGQKGKVVAMPMRKATWWKVAAIILVVIPGGIFSYLLLVEKGAENHVAQQTPSTEAAEMSIRTDSVVPAEKPLAKVEVLQKKEALDKNRTPSLITHQENQNPATAVQKSRLKADTGRVLLTDQATESAAFMDTSAQLPATLPVPTDNKTEALAIEARKTRISPPSGENDVDARETDTNKETSGLNASNSSSTEKKTVPNVRHLIEKKANGAEPINGWKIFEQYLERQIDSLKTIGFVDLKDDAHIEFSIDQKGQPTNIKVMGDERSTKTERLVQILKNGPKWQNKNNDQKVYLVITF